MQKQERVPHYPPAGLIRLFNRFRYFLLRGYRRFTSPKVTILEMVQSFYISRAIGVAAELNIAEFLKKGPLHYKEMAQKTHSNADALYRLLRLLASQEVFREIKPGVFKQTKLSATLVDSPDSMRYMVLHQTSDLNWDLFKELSYPVKLGEPAAKKILGKDLFQHLEENEERNERYNKAMSNTSKLASYAVISAYNFSNCSKIVDIGGGQGVLLSVILHKWKKPTGILFDFQHVVQGSEKIFEYYNVKKRVQTIAGDFFKEIPHGGDRYLLKNILHTLNDKDCIRLLKNIREVMDPRGRILIIEPVIPNNNRYDFAKLFDIQMLVSREGGRERKRAEYQKLFEKSQLQLLKMIPTAGPFSILEVFKQEDSKK